MLRDILQKLVWFNNTGFTYTELFLSERNTLIVYKKINTQLREYGRDKITIEDIKAQMENWALNYTDIAVSEDITETVDYMNDNFIKFVTEDLEASTNIDEVRFNPMRDNYFGKKNSDYMPEDYRNMDVWRDNSVFTDVRFQRPAVKGIMNPHVIGAHRRHYDSVDEGLRPHEKGLNRTYGYDMSVFDTAFR